MASVFPFIFLFGTPEDFASLCITFKARHPFSYDNLYRTVIKDNRDQLFYQSRDNFSVSPSERSC